MPNITLKFYDYSHVLIDTEQHIFYELKNHFSYFVENYQFHPKFKYTDWDGKISLLEKDYLLPFGLVKSLVDYAKSRKWSISIEQEITSRFDLSKTDFEKWINSRKYYSKDEEIYPHWYQLQSTYDCLCSKRRILNLPTSAGKSLIQGLLAKYVIEHSDLNVLIIVPTVQLVTQMKDDFVDYRLFNADEIAEVKAGSNQSKQRVVVSTWQSAVKKPDAWFQQFGMLLVDEVHLAVGKSISSIIKKLRFCEYKIGLSGSLRDGKANIMQYVGLFGAIVAPTSIRKLMDDGQICKLQINCLVLQYPQAVADAAKKWSYPEEIKFITNLKRRTEFICNLAHKLSSKNENVFVMFKHKEHGKRIYEQLKTMGHTKIHYVAGEIDPLVRDQIKKEAEENTGVIIIASYGVFSTGISVKNLHHVIFSHPIKSKTTVLQTIGRVLRKHQSKSIAYIWDVIDDFSMFDGKIRMNTNTTYKHARDRIARYKSEDLDFSLKMINLFK